CVATAISRTLKSGPQARACRGAAAAPRSLLSAQHCGQGAEDLVDLRLPDDQRRRERNDVARLAHQHAALEAFHKHLEGARAGFAEIGRASCRERVYSAGLERVLERNRL